MKKLTTITALALAAISLGTVAASAQVTPAAGANDLVLGFEATTAGSTGANTNLELDLGPASNFTSSASFNNLGLLGADLTSVYGSNWATRSDLIWAVAGVVGSNVLDVTSNTPPTERTSYVSSYIQGLTTTLNTGNATPATGVGAATIGDATTPASGIGGSFSNSLVGSSTGDFGFSSSVGINQAIVGGTSSGPDGSIDLYKFVRAGGTTTPASLLGDFVLSGSGTSATFAFNPVAAPEPSAYALAITAGLLFLVLRRRNSVA